MAEVKGIKQVSISQLVPYERNSKKHGEKQLELICESIKEFGFVSPCLIDKQNNVIAGHGRIEAAKMLGMEKVPCVCVEGLTEEQRRAYVIADNRLTELGEWDMDIVNSELIDLNNLGFDTGVVGFDIPFAGDEQEEDGKQVYTGKVNIPQYEPQDIPTTFDEMLDTEKADELISEIMKSTVTEDEKRFLIEAAKRHNKFNYKRVADYYASASEEMQKLMEKSALVIIDIGDAIANGYAVLSKEIEGMIQEE